MNQMPPFKSGRFPKFVDWRRGITSGEISAGGSGNIQLLVGDSNTLAESPEQVQATNDSGIPIPADTKVYILPPPLNGVSYFIFWADICEV